MSDRPEESGPLRRLVRRLVEVEARVFVPGELVRGIFEAARRRISGLPDRRRARRHPDTVEALGRHVRIRDRRQDPPPPAAVGATKRVDLEDALSSPSNGSSSASLSSPYQWTGFAQISSILITRSLEAMAAGHNRSSEPR
jgi:hypothetical protein